jgi:hypothetical protein
LGKNVIYEREFFVHGPERLVLRLEKQPVGLTIVRYVDGREQASFPFEEYYALETGPAHKAFVKIVETLVPRTAEFRPIKKSTR